MPFFCISLVLCYLCTKMRTKIIIVSIVALSCIPLLRGRCVVIYSLATFIYNEYIVTLCGINLNAPWRQFERSVAQEWSVQIRGVQRLN